MNLGKVLIDAGHINVERKSLVFLFLSIEVESYCNSCFLLLMMCISAGMMRADEKLALRTRYCHFLFLKYATI